MFTLLSLSLLCSHNDLPWNIRKFVHNELETVNFTHNLKYVEPWSKSPWSHTDIMRLADGMVGCQVSKVYTVQGSAKLPFPGYENVLPRM